MYPRNSEQHYLKEEGREGREEERGEGGRERGGRKREGREGERGGKRKISTYSSKYFPLSIDTYM